VVLLTALLGACTSTPTAASGGGGGKGKGKNFGGGGPVPVVVATVGLKDVPIEIQVVGNVEAYSAVSVRPQVSGQLIEVFVQDGDDIKKGARLFAIDPKPLEGQLNSGEANLARSRALLAQAEANLARDIAQEKYARGVADRASKLVDEGIVSRDQAEQQRSNADALGSLLAADRAAIESAKAQIQADQSAINNTRVQLAYTNISAPIDGRSGNVAQKSGNIVTANSTELMVINQIEPIYVTFAVPEARLADIKHYMAGGTLPVTVRPQDGSGSAETGKLTFIDNAVDTSTGTIKLKATFPNADHKLWPGQFVNVTLRLTTRGGAVVVPNQAVQTGQDGTFVYVVKEDRTVEVRPVTTGPRVDLDLVIDKGLSSGETVVTEGQLRLQPGSRVQMRDTRPGGGFKGGEGKEKSGEGRKGGPESGGEGEKQGKRRGPPSV
jgi:multidrug efflux system membrane fusion protein